MEIEFNNSDGHAIDYAIDSDSNNLRTSPDIRKDDDSSSDYDDVDDDAIIEFKGTPYHSNHHFYAPLEITSRPASVIIPNRTTNFFGIRRKRIKIILVLLFIIAATILVASLVERQQHQHHQNNQLVKKKMMTMMTNQIHPYSPNPSNYSIHPKTK